MKNDPGTPQFADLRKGLALVRWAAPFDHRPAPALSDVLCCRHLDRPWLLRIWEPLQTKAPSPAHCYPHCCYVRTTIFYQRPNVLHPPRPWRDRDGALRMGTTGGFVEFDSVDSRLNLGDIVAFDGNQFTIGSGRVVWKRRRWWVQRWAKVRA